MFCKTHRSYFRGVPVRGWFAGLMLILASSIGSTQIPTDARFQTLVLSEKFHGEGATVSDLNNDGSNDIVSGPFWYEGPDFRVRHKYTTEKDYSVKAYSDQFFSFAYDFNGDGWQDILCLPIPGGDGVWHENPGENNAIQNEWRKHLALKNVDNESPTFADITGDGKPELVCIHQGNFGYATWDTRDAVKPWTFTPISEAKGFGRFTHGLGVGDVDGDGRADILETNGWWQQTEDVAKPFRFHAMRFSQSGGSQMFAYDFDGDGDNDVVSVQNAHGFGLSWFERRGTGEDYLFVEHKITTDEYSGSPYGLSLSQMHALGLADIDGDGVLDIVTGKRFFAHGGSDPGAHQPAMLVWFRTARTKLGVEFIPHVIHSRSGVGTQIALADVDKNGHVDVVVGNKLGTFVSLNSGNAGKALPQQNHAVSMIGTKAFSVHVRETEPLFPEQEAATFQLPDGFEAQLVAAEPDIAKPMNLAFDARGRLWVSSSSEYPTPAPEGRQPKDTIKILEDTTGDGRADKITTFADGLNIPIGVYPYRDGAICFSIPNIIFLRDTDGDDQADERHVLYGPMDTTRDTHGMCNSFTRGFDGWLYACHGFNNQTQLTSPTGTEVEMHSGNTFRVRVDGTDIQHYTWGQINPFGLALNPQGDIFSADCHTKPISLLIKGGQYQGFGRPHDGLGFVPDVMEHLHGSTGIAGIAFYHDDQFPSVFRGDAFGGNVMTGRINRNSIHQIGGTIRAREEADFMVAGDPWFRPVDVQLGPDGALYVADFYNRIIGHYEVPLDHPGRDRHRGRIWRIAYTGNDRRRDVPVGSEPKRRAAVSNDLQTLIGDLSSPSLGRRLTAASTLVDQEPEKAGEAAKQLFADPRTKADALVQAAWILFRLNDLSPEMLAILMQDSNPLLRNHGLRILAETKNVHELTVEWIRQGLADPDGSVRRSSAIAAMQHLSPQLIAPLLESIQVTAPADVQTRHALRMALRDHLRNAEWFAAATGSLTRSHVPTVIDICLALKTDFAGEFMVENLDSVTDDSIGKIAEYLSFAARYASQQSYARIVEIACERFPDDFAFQEKLIESVRQGILQRGARIPVPIKEWATQLAARRLGIDHSNPNSLPARGSVAIVWSELPHPDVGDKTRCWGVSRKRNSADGQKNSQLHSSFVHGETRTGILRSGAFNLPAEFTFYLAGHDGVPGKPIQSKNLVRVHDEATGVVLRQWSPPRNDTAQAIRCDTGGLIGRRVYVELVDGDAYGAYAWLAVGRFSLAGLNRSPQQDDWRIGVSLIGDFQLEQLRYVLIDLMKRQELDPGTLQAVARASLSQSPSATAFALVESLLVKGVDGELRKLVTQQIAEANNSKATQEAIEKAMGVADSAAQKRIAGILASEAASAEILIRCIESGRASATLLNDPKIKATITAIADEKLKKRIEELVESIPPQDAQMQKWIDERTVVLTQKPGDRSRGAKLFEKQCAVCHQVAGKGKQVGPNLDGIGNRGLARLSEDVLMPNRNIDVAFRATLLLTDDGKVHSGLARPDDGGQTVLIDSAGKEIRLDTESITSRKQTLLSPMPANFAETLNDSQCQDLFAYLLSLTL